MQFKSPIVPIILAEIGSSIVSIGAVIMVSRHEKAFEPTRNFIARHVIYPCIAHKSAPKDIDEKDPVFASACKKASGIIKGAAMIGSGFVAHVPIQLALEGRFDPKSFKQVSVGKGGGLGVALGGMFVIDKVAPAMLPGLRKIITPVLARCMSKHAAEEASKFLTVDAGSSLASGAANYLGTRYALGLLR